MDVNNAVAVSSSLVLRNAYEGGGHGNGKRGQQQRTIAMALEDGCNGTRVQQQRHERTAVTAREDNSNGIRGRLQRHESTTATA